MDKNIARYENESRLLANQPIYVDKISIYSPKLIDIILIGEMNYSLYLYVCILENININMPYENKYDNLINTTDKDFLQYHYAALEFFTGQLFEKIEYEGDIIFLSEASVLHRHNFDSFIESIKLANCIEADTKESVNRNSELDRKIAEAKKRINQELNKKDSEDDIRLKDLVSVLASKHNNLNIMTAWDLNYCQFNDQFKRMQLIENYDIGVRSLLAGVDKKEVQLEYYIKKL